MSPTLSNVPAARPRWRSIIATFALVGALVATTSAMSASADVVGTGPGTVSGTVTTDTGQPVEGAFVNVSISLGQGTPFGVSTSTDATGHYEFSGLDLGAYDVSTYVSGYQQPASQSAVLTESSPTGTFDFVLAPFAVGVGTISGVVTGDGVPLANVFVSAYSPSGQNLSTLTDENGYYEFTALPNGQWSIYASGGLDYQYLNPPPVQLTDGATSATLDFPFLSWPVGTSSISGVVTDAATGEPLADVSVSVYSNNHNSHETTDAAGAYTVDLLPEGTYYLSFSSFSMQAYLHTNREIQLGVGESATADVALFASNSTISGHIKEKNGTPVVGIYVNAYTADGNIGSAATDENGDYLISDVGAVAYTLNVGGVGTPYNAKEQIVTPIANGNGVANFTLKDRKTGTLGGFVAGPDGQWYQQPVCVTLYSSKNKHVVAETATWGPEFGDGSYSFNDLKPGSYTVKFADCDDDPFKKFDDVFLGGVAKYNDATFVTVGAGQDSWENSITLSYRAANSTITGHIAKPNGTPIAGLTVSAVGEDSTGSAVTNANGDYAISGLFNGEYTVSVGGAGTLYVHKEKSVTAVEGGSVTANFSLGKK